MGGATFKFWEWHESLNNWPRRSSSSNFNLLAMIFRSFRLRYLTLCGGRKLLCQLFLWVVHLNMHGCAMVNLVSIRGTGFYIKLPKMTLPKLLMALALNVSAIRRHNQVPCMCS